MIAIFRQHLFKFVEDMSKAEERLDALYYDFCEIIKVLGIDLPATTKSTTCGIKRGQLTEHELGLKRRAAEGVTSVKLIPQADGSKIAHLDGDAGVSLTPSLAALLEVLAADKGKSPDHLVSWKALPEILEGLKIRTGKNFTKKAVRQLVHRLRNQLKHHGENHFYVLSSREDGYRFALRHGSDAVTSDDHN
jgi:DNA-binding winged helix-turn-helix (wHTH) protein